MASYDYLLVKHEVEFQLLLYLPLDTSLMVLLKYFKLLLF